MVFQRRVRINRTSLFLQGKIMLRRCRWFIIKQNTKFTIITTNQFAVVQLRLSFVVFPSECSSRSRLTVTTVSVETTEKLHGRGFLTIICGQACASKSQSERKRGVWDKGSNGKAVCLRWLPFSHHWPCSRYRKQMAFPHLAVVPSLAS